MGRWESAKKSSTSQSTRNMSQIRFAKPDNVHILVMFAATIDSLWLSDGRSRSEGSHQTQTRGASGEPCAHSALPVGVHFKKQQRVMIRCHCSSSSIIGLCLITRDAYMKAKKNKNNLPFIPKENVQDERTRACLADTTRLKTRHREAVKRRQEKQFN